MNDAATPQEDASVQGPTVQEPAAAEIDLPAQIIQEELTRLRQALEEKTREAEAAHGRYLRALAELDNTRKRAQREREEYLRFANESLLRELLPVLDNFDRAIRGARMSGVPEVFVAGLGLMQRDLLRVLEKFGVTPFSSVGEPFNPERHEAVARVLATDHPEMTVVEETLRGYLLNGRVLRTAKVTVAVPSDEPSSSDG